jgi:hypothetical protein
MLPLENFSGKFRYGKTYNTHKMQLNYTFFQTVFSGILQRAQAAGTISEEELIHFWNTLKQAEQEQHFFAGAVGFIVSGQKPL